MKLLVIFSFLLHLRFPTRTPISAIIERRYGRPTLQTYRRLEQASIQSRKLSLDINFLETCKLYNLTPSFLIFRLYNKRLHHSIDYKNFQQKLLNNEIKCKYRQLRQKTTATDNLRNSFRNQVSWLDYNILSSLIGKRKIKFTNTVKAKHAKKLKHLGHFTNEPLDPRTIVTNLSNLTLTNDEYDTLALGLDFALPIRKPNKIKHHLNFEILGNSLKNETPYNVSSPSIRHSISHTANQSYFDFKNWKHLIPTDNASDKLQNLRNNKDIIVTKPDKGRGVVIMNKQDYICKTETILNDKTKFKMLPKLTDPYPLMLRYETAINTFLNKLKKAKKISDSTYRNLRTTGSHPGILYALPKIHKENTPVRPILSAIGTHNYQLAKFLVPILEPITTNEFTIKNSHSFASELKELKFNHPIYIASFDITQLYTNIPLQETIDICLDSLCDNDNMFVNLTRNELNKFLTLATNNSTFYFNDNLYEQLDGLAMGGPLGGHLANIFLCYNEKRWLEQCPLEFKPLYYKRYLDDTFIIFKDPSHANLFCNYLNNCHKDIQFTSELENNQTLNYLDLSIKHLNGTFDLSVYRKSTFSGLGTKYTSFIPQLFKTNSISTLIYRAYNICSNWKLFDCELNFLLKYFTQNGYPPQIIHRFIRNFLNNKFNPPQVAHTAHKLKLYIKLQYYGPQSHSIRNNLLKFLQPAYPQIDFRFIFTNNFTIRSLFPFKDRIPNVLKSNVIYEFSCSSCEARYIGKTSRCLYSRICEHKGISDRFKTTTRLAAPPFSSIRHHKEQHDHQIHNDNFKLIDHASNPYTLSLLESIHIKLSNPSLNQQVHFEDLITL